MYQYILFDLDGTIINSAEGIMNSLRDAFQKFKIPLNTYEELYPFIGPPIRESLKEFAHVEEENLIEVIQHYRNYYIKKGLYECYLYPYIIELLNILKEKGKKLALATNKPYVYSKKILDNFHITSYFDYIGAPRDDDHLLNKTDIIQRIIQELKIKNLKDVIMIGDRYFDIEGAKNNRIDSIGVLYGFGSREELAQHQATFIVNEVKDILKIIEKI